MQVGSGVETDATSPNIVGPTVLGVVASVWSVVCKRMQQLLKKKILTVLAHHGCWSITQSYGVTVSNETMCDARGWPQLFVRRAVQTDPTWLRYAPAITEQKKCLVLLAEKIDRFQPLHTSPNNMQQGAQTDAIYNIQQCWELLTNKVAPVFTGLKPLFQRGS